MIDLVQTFSHLGYLITSDSDNGEDITFRKHSFIRQINNTYRYFGNLSSFAKYNLFHAYRTKYYGCELWSPSNSKLKSFVLLGERAWGASGDFRFRLTVFYNFCLKTFPSYTKYVGVHLILLGHVYDLNLLSFHLLLCTDCTLVVVHFLDGTYCAERFNCSVNDLI